jgi:hypothetical protein
MTSTGFPTVSHLPLYFFWKKYLVMNSISAYSLWVDDLVKGLLNHVSLDVVGEAKCNFLPFLAVVLAKGTYSSSGAG